MGVSSLYWAYRGSDDDYAQMVASQPLPVRLTRDDFADLHAYTCQRLQDARDLQAALWAVLCNDLGKLDEVVALFRKYRKSGDIAELDHDQILGRILTLHPEAFEAFSQLRSADQQALAAGLNSGSDVAHLAHLEIPASTLDGTRRLTPRERAIYVLHSIFDVAGAAAHRCARGSITMTHETWGIYKDVSAALKEFDLSGASSAEVFESYVQRRASRVGISRVEPDWAILSIIGAMARLSSPEDGLILRRAWQSLSAEQRISLRNELGLYIFSSAATVVPIQISYGPTLIHNARSTLHLNGDSDADFEGLRLGLGLMTKIYVAAREALKQKTFQGRLPPAGLFFVDARSVAADVAPNIKNGPYVSVRFEPQGYGASCQMVHD